MIDIRSRSEGLAGRLSNLASREFIFHGILCSCLEGPIQAFKYEDIETQIEVCSLLGSDAKRKGQERNDVWRSRQVLWWMGEEYPRGSMEYRKLLEALYLKAFSQDTSRHELLSTGDQVFCHSIGIQDQTMTVLTEFEFCYLLMLTREKLRDLRKWK